LIDNIETVGKHSIIFESDPKLIVERVIAELDERYADFKQDIARAPRPGKYLHS
jgi:hypothetical protein